MPLQKSVIKTLQSIVGKRYVHTAREVLKTYECDGCLLVKEAPECVVLPNSTQEVAAVVKLCHQNKIPFVARGAGTGLSGGALTKEGGVIIGLSRMNRLIEIDTVTQTATVEAGIVNAWITKAVRPYQLFFAPDPSSQSVSTLGGNIAENAGGIHCVKYGVTTDHILGLEVVTSEGEVIWLGGKHGQQPSVNLMGIWVGSEGTFGVVTQAVVKLTPMPQQVKVFLAAFQTLKQSTDAIMAIIGSGVQPAALEFMDEVTVKAVNEAFQMGFPENAEALILVELDGDEEALQAGEAVLERVFQQYHALQVQSATDEAERLKLWKARKSAVAAYGRILPAFYLHDCVIPRSMLTEVLQAIQAIGKQYDVIVGNVFHAGDGNLHPNILLDPDDPAMVKRVLEAGEAMLQVCLSVGGVISGEHGIGLEKAESMAQQYTSEELAVMKRLKAVFNKSGLANPQKIFPQHKGCGETNHGVAHELVAQRAMAINTENNEQEGLWI